MFKQASTMIEAGYPSLDNWLALMRLEGYPIFKKDEKPYNLNICAWRNPCPVVNKSLCALSIAYKYKGRWFFQAWTVTTYPGRYWLRNLLNPKGTAIIKEGFYRGAYRIGLHKGKYLALVQDASIKVYRDKDQDDEFDLRPDQVEDGVFGINIHKAGINSVRVGKWSAGCIVFKKSSDFFEFMEYIKKGVNHWGNQFSLAVINPKIGELSNVLF